MNILIIDDHPILKEGVTKRVEKVIPNATCIFVTNYKTAIDKIYEQKIDLVFCDLSFGKESDTHGFFIIESIIKLNKKIKIIAYTTFDAYRIMKKTLKLGVNSYLDKATNFNEFAETLTGVLELEEYDSVFNSASMKRIFKRRYSDSETVFRDSLLGISSLSQRELELLIYYSKSAKRQDLATLMDISPATVDKHFKNIINKLNLQHRKELTLFYEEFQNEIQEYVKKNIN